MDSVLFFIEKTCFLDLRAHEFQSHFQPQAAIVRAIFTTWMFFLQEETSKETFKDANRSGQEWAVRVKRIISLSPKRSNPPRTYIVGLRIKVVNDHSPLYSPHALAIFGPQNR